MALNFNDVMSKVMENLKAGTNVILNKASQNNNGIDTANNPFSTDPQAALTNSIPEITYTPSDKPEPDAGATDLFGTKRKDNSLFPDGEYVSGPSYTSSAADIPYAADWNGVTLEDMTGNNTNVLNPQFVPGNSIQKGDGRWALDNDFIGGTDIPYVADYNGFNFADYGNAGQHSVGDEQVRYNAQDEFNKALGGNDARTAAEKALTAEDQARKDWMDYLANNNLGTKYKSTAEFQLNGSEKEWEDAILSNELSKYYEDVFKEYGGSKENFDFKRYWDDHKPKTYDQIMKDNLVQQYFGTSTGNVDDAATYMVSNYNYYDKNLQDLFSSTDAEKNAKLAVDMLSYAMGDKILQDILAKGGDSNDLFNAFSVNELNQLFRADPNMYTTSSEDTDGLLADWGKNNPDLYQHSTEVNIPAYRQYEGAPYAGLADTLTALAGDKLYHKKRPKPESDQEGSEQ